MKTASSSTPATDGQYGELKTMFERTARAAVSDKEAVQRLLGRWNQIGPAIAPILLRYSFDLTLIDSALLQPISTLTLPASKVTPRDLKNGVAKGEGGVKMKLWLGENVEKLLQGHEGVIESTPTEGRIHQLRQASVDVPILEELGGEEIARISFAHMWGMVLAQAKGQSGPLLTSGDNIFYPEEFPGWAFYFYWYSGNREWILRADPVAYSNYWLAGYQVVSH